MNVTVRTEIRDAGGLIQQWNVFLPPGESVNTMLMEGRGKGNVSDVISRGQRQRWGSLKQQPPGGIEEQVSRSAGPEQGWEPRQLHSEEQPTRGALGCWSERQNVRVTAS